MTDSSSPGIFLAGATGAIGRPLLQLLLRRGYRVFAMTRTPERMQALWALGAIPIVVDALDAERVMQAIAAVRPAAVIHQLTDLPAKLDPSNMADALQRNANVRRHGTANLVAAAVAAGVQRFVAQSIAWAYRHGAEPHTEEAPLDTDATGARGISVGGVVSLEKAVLGDPRLRGCVLRYGHLYGPGTDSVDAKGKEIPLHVEAAAWAALLALERDAVGVFNVAECNAQVTTAKARRDLEWDDALRLSSLHATTTGRLP